MTSIREKSWQLRTVEIVTLQLKCSVEHLREIPEPGAVGALSCRLSNVRAEGETSTPSPEHANKRQGLGWDASLLLLGVLVVFFFSCVLDLRFRQQ